MEQSANPHLDRFIEMDLFVVGKVLLVKYSRASVVMPGSVGALDEAIDTLTLVQCRKFEQFPVVGMGSEFWGHMRNFVRETLVNEQRISPEDLDLLRITGSPQEALAYIKAGVAILAATAGGLD